MPKEITEKDTAAAYQPLFDLLSKEHKLTLTMSQMDEIMQACAQVNKNASALYSSESPAVEQDAEKAPNA